MGIYNRWIFADKACLDEDYFSKLERNQNAIMVIPVKTVKGEEQIIWQIGKAADDLFSTAVSTIRQPIEYLFNWQHKKTPIQRAMKTISTSGLLIHTMEKFAIAFISLFFKN